MLPTDCYCVEIETTESLLAAGSFIIYYLVNAVEKNSLCDTSSSSFERVESWISNFVRCLSVLKRKDSLVKSTLERLE